MGYRVDVGLFNKTSDGMRSRRKRAVRPSGWKSWLFSDDAVYSLRQSETWVQNTVAPNRCWLSAQLGESL